MTHYTQCNMLLFNYESSKWYFQHVMVARAHEIYTMQSRHQNVITLGLRIMHMVNTFIWLWCAKKFIRFTHIFQGTFTGTGVIIWLPQCQWRNPEWYVLWYHMNQVSIGNMIIAKQNHSQSVCIFYGFFYMWQYFIPYFMVYVQYFQ